MAKNETHGMTGRVHHRRIPGTKLTEWEHRYVLFYCADPTKTNAEILTEIGYPCDPKFYPFRGSAMWRKPAVQEAIHERMQDVMKRLDMDMYKVLKRLVDLAMTDSTDVVDFKDGKVNIKNFDTLKANHKAIIAGVEQTPGEFGTATRIKFRDPYPALEKLLRVLGADNPSRQSAVEPHKLQKAAIQAVRSKKKSVIDACLDLEEAGVPIPQTLLIMLSKQAGETPEDDGPMVIPTPEEMAARAEAKMREINAQRETFLPERREQVAQIKKEMAQNGRGDSFAPENVKDEGTE
ncbi:hypothetical protein JCM15519_15320 [Fundidesulfovibrio butyratiphilus]